MSNTNYTYRVAKIADMAIIKPLAVEMLAETKLGAATDKKISYLLSSPSINFDLAFADGVCVGFMVGVIHENIFNDITRASDIGLFVTKSHRGSEVAVKLVERFETWAKSKRATQVWLGQSTGHKIENTKSFYEKLGYTVFGVNTMKEI